MPENVSESFRNFLSPRVQRPYGCAIVSHDKMKWKYEALAQTCYLERNEISVAVTSHFLINLFSQTRGPVGLP